MKPVDRVPEQLARLGVARRRTGVEQLPRRDDARADGLRALTWRRCKLDSAHTRHRDDEIEPVEERARELVAVVGEPLRRATALRSRVASASARAKVHRPDE